MKLFCANERQKIEKINHSVRPLVERLVQAIHGIGIGQNNLFSIYPVYFEYNRIQNELNRLVFYAQNGARIQELQLNLAKARNELDQTERRTQDDLYNLFQPLLASSDYVLMASIVAKCLSVAFQLELEQNFFDWAAEEKKSNEVAQLNRHIDMKRISLDVIWRELMLLFNQVPDDNT